MAECKPWDKVVLPVNELGGVGGYADITAYTNQTTETTIIGYDQHWVLVGWKSDEQTPPNLCSWPSKFRQDYINECPSMRDCPSIREYIYVVAMHQDEICISRTTLSVPSIKTNETIGEKMSQEYDTLADCKIGDKISLYLTDNDNIDLITAGNRTIDATIIGALDNGRDWIIGLKTESDILRYLNSPDLPSKWQAIKHTEEYRKKFGNATWISSVDDYMYYGTIPKYSVCAVPSKQTEQSNSSFGFAALIGLALAGKLVATAANNKQRMKVRLIERNDDILDEMASEEKMKR